VLLTLAAFAAGQGAAQFISVATGLLLLRWLPTDAYGQYGLVFSFQCTIGILADLGLGGTVIALAGRETGHRSVVGAYVRAGRGIRTKLLYLIFPLFSLYFFNVTAALNWGLQDQFSMLSAILISTQSSGLSGYYGAALRLNGHITSYYSLQVMAASVRLICSWLLFKTANLSGVSAVWANTLGIACLALAMQVAGKRLIDEPSRPDRRTELQMARYILPNLPEIVFFALQGQIAVVLIATFGHGRGIAQVAALGRLGQIFAFLNAFNPAVLEPWFARTPRERLTRRFTGVMAGSIIIASSITALAITAPGLFLALLGPRYASLRVEVMWSVASSCVLYLLGIVWTASSASRFVYWHTTWLKIVSLLVVQTLFVSSLGVSTPLRAVQFGFCTACVSFAVDLYNFLYGLVRGPRVLPGTQVVAASAVTESAA
jgi:O-antigen/teichoic acid export membrane protein